MAELLHQENGKKVDIAMEEERERRMSILSLLTDEEKVKKHSLTEAHVMHYDL